jgi:ubiquitin carboxyl-terminal hydrolase 25/28
MDPDRRSWELQTGIRVLEALSSYLKDALWHQDDTPKTLPAHNKRFMTSFGDDCEVLLLWLGFRKKEIVEENGEIVEHKGWILPQPPPVDPFKDGTRGMLEDACEELWAKIRGHSVREQKEWLKRPLPDPKPLADTLKAMLGTDDYPTNRLRVSIVSQEQVKQYEGLGALSDFSDGLIKYCFRRQVEYNREASSYYFDCLSGLALKRDNDELNIEIAMLASEGFVTQSEVARAYRYLGYSEEELENLDDGQILGSFNARLESSPRHQESELREQLRIIGNARGSDTLISAAENGESYLPADVWSPKIVPMSPSSSPWNSVPGAGLPTIPEGRVIPNDQMTPFGLDSSVAPMVCKPWEGMHEEVSEAACWIETTSCGNESKTGRMIIDIEIGYNLTFCL